MHPPQSFGWRSWPVKHTVTLVAVITAIGSAASASAVGIFIESDYWYSHQVPYGEVAISHMGEEEFPGQYLPFRSFEFPGEDSASFTFNRYAELGAAIDGPNWGNTGSGATSFAAVDHGLIPPNSLCAVEVQGTLLVNGYVAPGDSAHIVSLLTINVQSGGPIVRPLEFNEDFIGSGSFTRSIPFSFFWSINTGNAYFNFAVASTWSSSIDLNHNPLDPLPLIEIGENGSWVSFSQLVDSFEVTVTPEPSSLTLLGCAALGFLAMTCRRRGARSLPLGQEKVTRAQVENPGQA